MKKFILVIAVLIGTLVACDRELELGSDFDFKVNNITDSQIFINSLKSFELEIIKTNNVIDNKTYNFSYRVASGNLIVKDGSSTLIAGNFYPFETNNLNKINLNLIPQSNGVITVDFILKDNNGVEKTKKILVYCTDEDFQFTFTGTAPTPTAIVGSGIGFSLDLANTGLGGNSFQLKYSSSGSGTISINSQVRTPNTYFAVTPGTIQGLFTSNNVGTETVVLTCLDAGGHEKQVVFSMTMTASPFALAKINDFSVKNTLQKEFNFVLSNTLAAATYQVKFTSVNSSKIFKGTTQLTMNTWINLTFNPNNLYAFLYEANSDTNDILTVQVKDNFGQIQSINYTVTVFSKPIVTSHQLAFTRQYISYDGLPNGYVSNYATRSNVQYNIFGGATCIQTKIFIKNKITGSYETFVFDYATQYETLESSSANGTSQVLSLQNCINQSKYAGQLYTVQIKDSDGVFSDVYNGTVINY